MKKRALSIFMLLGLFLLINSVDAKVINCGNDYDCFLNASVNCEKSKVEVIESEQFEYIIFDVRTQMRIKGMKKDNCIFSVKNQKINLMVNETLLDEFIQNNTELNITILDKKDIKKLVRNFNNQLKQYKDISGTCKLLPSQLTSLLKTWEFGFFNNQTETQIEGCKGRFFRAF